MTAELKVEIPGRVAAAQGLVITDLQPVLLSYTYPEADVQTWSGGYLPGVTAGLVRISTSDGVTGHGETYAGNYAPEVVRALVDYFRPYVVGRDVSDIAGLWHECYSRTVYWGRFGIAISVLSAIEAAAWDLCGKVAGQPVHRLLGGPVRERLPYYASGGMDASPEDLRAEMAHYRDVGFTAVKIRAGLSPEADRAKAELCREVLGPGIGLAVDAVQGSNPRPWSASEAIAAGQRLTDLDLLWYEEPCAATDVEGYRACRRALDIPIAGGESCTTLLDFEPFLSEGAVDIAQPDAAHVGGIIETLRIAALAAERGIEVAVHAWASGGCVMANYHAGFAAANCRWLEYPTQPNPLVTELLTEPLRVVDGYVMAPTAPGLGIDVTPELEARYPYRPGHHYVFKERRS